MSRTVFDPEGLRPEWADNFNPSVSSGLTSSSLSNLGVEDLSGVEWVKFFFGGTQFRIRKANTNRLYEKFRKKSNKKGLRAKCTTRSPMVANFVRDFTDARFVSIRSSLPRPQNTEYDVHVSPRFLGLGMCGFDQATTAQLLCRYISIVDVVRQGQQKIRTFAVLSGAASPPFLIFARRTEIACKILIGAPRRTRTSNFFLKRELLYQLS